MKRKINWNVMTCTVIIILSVLCGILVYFGTFEMIDYTMIDVANRYLEMDKDKDVPISIIMIDDRTVAEYGAFETWSRQVSADFVQTLNAQEEKPVIIGMDLPYLDEKDEQGDQAFVDACAEGGNICLSVRQSEEWMKEQVKELSKGTRIRKEIELPYEALQDVVQMGIGNNFINEPNGAVREFIAQIESEEKQMDGFAVVLYKKYQEHAGKTIAIDFNNQTNMHFNYARNMQEYKIYSFVDVMKGVVDVSVFKNQIVIVGDETNGLMYKAPLSIDSKMQGVLVQAYMVEAMLSQTVIQRLPQLAMAIMCGGLIFLCNYLVCVLKKKRSILFIGIIWYLHFQVWYVLKDTFYLPIFALWLFILLSVFARFTIVHFKGKQERKQMQRALETYVEPGVVEQILKNEDFEIHLGGKKKDIAVLFVDIRGFTSISEALEPEAVVNILNEYLELIARAIIKNEGTLDKFIGDAAMALYNAPNDLPNYTLQAVKTANDMIQGAVHLKEQSIAKYGVEVSFGVGIHCGPAIVGNVGCECHMDYTAIGDVVNTASRLEGKAKADQILVSKEVYEQVKDFVEGSFVGNLSLKGKKKEIEAYEITKIKERM